MARVEYSEWQQEQEDPKFAVYMISGHHHWKQEFMKSMKKKYDTEYTLVNKGITEHIKKLNYRPLGKKKHLLMYESLDRMSKEDLNEMINYVKKPSKYGIFVLSITSWAEKKDILNNFKFLDKSTIIKFFDLDFPSNKFVQDYIQDTCNRFGVHFEAPTDFSYLVRRISPSTQNIINNIQTLSTLDTAINKEAIKTYTDDYSAYTYNKLYSALGKLDRKKIPYIAYNDLIEAGKKESTIMINIMKHFHYLYQAKYLKIKGILRNDDIIDLKKHLYEKSDVQFKNNSIFDLPDYKINYYLRESDNMSLKDIVMIKSIIEKNMPLVVYRAEGVGNEDIPDKILKRRSHDLSVESFETILEILTRRKE